MSTIQYHEELRKLGYDVKDTDTKNILILDYSLSCGWQQTTTNLLLHIPSNHINGIHGIQIPSTLRPDADKKLLPPRIPNNYVQGWDLLSFCLESSLCDENILRNHMILIKRVLSFQDHKT